MTQYAEMFGQGGLNDQVDVDSLMREIDLDREEIAWRKEFVNFDDEDAQRLADLRPLFEAHTEAIADQFYENLTQYEQTVEVIGRSPKGVDHLKQTQQRTSPRWPPVSTTTTTSPTGPESASSTTCWRCR
jgi:hypothetical protein